MSEQYLAAHDGDDDDEEAAAAALPSVGAAKEAAAPRSGFLSRFLKKRKVDKGSQDEATSEPPANKYTPHLYAERRVHFIQQAKADGVSFKEAREAWNESDSKRAMLATVSLPELKRRRFVEKGCTVNPFCLARAGA